MRFLAASKVAFQRAGDFISRVTVGKVEPSSSSLITLDYDGLIQKSVPLKAKL